VTLRAGKAAEHGWLGIEVAPIDEVIQKRFRLPSTEGALVNRVLPGSPAEKAGLKRGDVIRKLGDKPIASPDEMIRTTARAKPAERVLVTVIRGGSEREIAVTLDRRPETVSLPEQQQEEQPEEGPAPAAGWRWEGVDFREEKGNVTVAEIAPDSKLFGYLLPQDVVVGVNQSEVRSLPQLKRALTTARLEEGVVFDILRNGQPMYISIQVGK